MKKILVIQHIDDSEPDAGLIHLRNRGCDVRVIRPFAGDAVPRTPDVDGVMLMGGPQMVTDISLHPYLQAETDLAMRAVDRQIPLLAICLGAQMIAHRLGAKVDWHAEGAVAFGYHEIKPAPAANGLFPPGLHVLSGNAQGFDLPSGATLLATGDTWPNQAFSIGERALAFQFHPEVTRGILDDWQRDLAGNIGKPGATDFDTQNSDFIHHDPALKDWYRSRLDSFFELASPNDHQR